MKNRAVIILALLLILPEVSRAECDAYDQTYRYKSAVFYVTNARRIRVSVYNSMGDIYPRCFTAWIKINGNYVNLNGLPYSPSNWQLAWASTAPNCINCGYPIVLGYSGSVEYDLSKYAPSGYTGEVEVRVSSDCYEIQAVDPCFCWTAKVEVIEQAPCTTLVTIAVSPNIIYQGDVIKISGRVTSSILVDPIVELYLDDNLIATVSTDASGFYSYSYKTPSSISIGSHTVKAVSKINGCVEGSASASFNVIALPQYCSLEIHVKDQKGNPLVAYIYVDGNYLTYASSATKQVQVGTHTVSASKPSYYSDSKTISCSCSETKKVELILTPIQVCIPGEIRNKYCACSTQVAYEKCKGDGSGWETVIESCASGYVCENGFCVRKVEEKDGWYDTGKERCNLYGLECGYGTKEKEQEYRDYTCIGLTCSYVVTQKRWVSIGECYQSCASGYTCQAGYCIKVTTTTLPTCSPRYLDEFKCYGNWVQRKYLFSDCSTAWVNWEYCIYGCSEGACSWVPKCKEGYLDNFRCNGNWVQREYMYSDCSTSWRNLEYCEYGCSSGICMPKPEDKISLSISVPSFLTHEDVTATIKITNPGSIGNYIDFGAWVCKSDSHCIPMSCGGRYDPIVYVPAYSTRTLTCTARVGEEGNYKIKVSYSGFGKTGVVYSQTFWVEMRETKCIAEFLNESKCSGNWRLQLYRYSDCSTAWVYVEYCAAGCSEGACLPKVTTTTLPEEKVEEKREKVPFTGLVVWPEQFTFAVLILILFLAALVMIWLWKEGKFDRKDKPEWFGEDC